MVRTVARTVEVVMVSAAATPAAETVEVSSMSEAAAPTATTAREGEEEEDLVETFDV